MLSLRRPSLVVDLDFIEPNGSLLWSSSNAFMAGKINAKSFLSKPLKLFSCYVSTINEGASSLLPDISVSNDEVDTILMVEVDAVDPLSSLLSSLSL